MNKILIASALVLGSFGACGVASAAPRLSPLSIIVNPVPTELAVRVYTDKDLTGNRTPNYRVGDRIRLYVGVNQDAYVYLFNVNPDGSIDQILPNSYASGSNYLRGGEVRQFPGANDQYTFDIAGPYGLNKIFALASKTPLDLAALGAATAQSGFATLSVRGQDKLAQALSIVVNPIPQNTWITDVALYNTLP